MNEQPSLNGSNGRGHNGRFLPGNPGGVGNPHAKKINQIRAALFSAIRPADIKLAVQKLVASAKAGDRHALAELLDRVLGKAIPADVEERVAELERLVAEKGEEDER